MQKEINNIIRSKVAQYAKSKGLKVAYPNCNFDSKSETYLELHIMPATTLSMDVAGGMRTYKGVCQININTQAGAGVSQVLEIANELIKLFDLNNTLSDDNIKVHVVSVPNVLPSITQNFTFTQPISFNYRADI
ncbi:phage tail terminator-like protein [Thorsellia kenyensis]|uniref:Phage tail terminator-like protein n=1 Tax=Thorsellia kenyensis TaxID=1549888 RepID=A0ABV6C7S8_9GAMM